jgi:hypothetical protein
MFKPVSVEQDVRQTEMSQKALPDSAKVYGSPSAGNWLLAITVRRKLHENLRDQSET